MHKLRCPHCGVINLEKFITYPQCAGCGNTLPQQSTPSAVPFWKRPVRPVAWVSLIGICLALLIWAASVFQAKPESEAQIAFFGDTSRRVTVGSTVTLSLSISALGETRRERARPLRDVQLRIPLRIFQTLRYVSIEPPADRMEIIGNGRYFIYETLERDTAIRLRLRATEPGNIRVPITAYVTDYMPNDWNIRIRSVKPRR